MTTSYHCHCGRLEGTTFFHRAQIYSRKKNAKEQKMSTVTFYYLNCTKCFDQWIGFDSVEHKNIISALQHCQDGFAMEGTFDRIKAEHFKELAYDLALSDTSGVSVYIPDAYDETVETTLVDALEQKDWARFLRTLDIDDDFWIWTL